MPEVKSGSSFPSLELIKPSALRAITPHWVTQLGKIAIAFGGLVTLAWAWVSIDLPEENGSTFVAFACIGALCIIVAEHLLELRMLSAVQALNDDPAPGQKVLIAAGQALVRTPRRFYFLVLWLMAVGASGTSMLWLLVVGADWVTALRLGLVSFGIGSFACLSGSLFIGARVRVALAALVRAGLTEIDVQNLGNQSPLTRRRLVQFGASAVAVPGLLLVDLGFFSTAPNSQLLVVALVAVALVTFAALVVGTLLSGPIIELEARALRISRGIYAQLGQNGEGFSRPLIAEYETLAAARSVIAMEMTASEVRAQLSEVRGALAHSGLAELALSSRGEHQVDVELTSTSEATGAVAQSARHIASTALRVAALAQKTWETSQSGELTGAKFLSVLQDVKTGNQSIAESVMQLNKRVQQVGRVVDFINGIADTTELLALNAEIEGHRAGDNGRGFSLVAGEMRRLSESVVTSTAEISNLISEVRDATHATVMATEVGMKTTESGAAEAESVLGVFRNIVKMAAHASAAVASISGATAQQRQGSQELDVAMREIVTSAKASGLALKGLQVTARELETVRQTVFDEGPS
jgi:methyl-accepting chemotaxis protein